MGGCIIDGGIDRYFMRFVVMLVDVADEKIIVLVPLVLVKLAHNFFFFSLFHLLFLDFFQMQLQKILSDLVVG